MLTVVLLLAAAVSWWVWHQNELDKADENQQRADDIRVMPLLRGINFLLSDQADLALQEMVQVARLRSDAIDVYMALGEMFRASGEIGRAVRIHQNLLARPDIQPEQALEAHFALGRDFHTGGLLDRALKKYEKALAIDSGHLPSLEASLRIREQGKEWLKAEALLCRIERVRGEDAHFHRAFLYAEEARRCLHDDQDSEQAMEYAEQAMQLDEGCASAHLIQLELLMGNQAPWDAVETLLQGLWQHCRHHALQSIALLVQSDRYRADSEPFLLKVWRDSRDEGMMLLWLERLHQAGFDDDARRLIDVVGFQPSSLRGDLHLLSLQSADGSSANQGLIQRAQSWRLQVKDFICEACGVEVREMRWQCPQCHQWGSMRAIGGDSL